MVRQAERQLREDKVQGRLFGLMTVSNQTGKDVDEAIDGTSVARMLDSGNILELIDNAFNNGTFAQ